MSQSPAAGGRAGGCAGSVRRALPALRASEASGQHKDRRDRPAKPEARARDGRSTARASNGTAHWSVGPAPLSADGLAESEEDADDEDEDDDDDDDDDDDERRRFFAAFSAAIPLDGAELRSGL